MNPDIKASKSDISALFPDTYDASRRRFRTNLANVRKLWPQAQEFQHKLPGDDDLTIDWIYSDALVENQKVFILTTGEHGVEGYVGSAMLQRFIDIFMPRLTQITQVYSSCMPSTPGG